MSHTGGRKILRIEKKLKQSIRAALIPHADRVYAGHARYAALRYFKKNTKEIIYLATLHNANPSDTFLIVKIGAFHTLGIVLAILGICPDTKKSSKNSMLRFVPM